MNISGWLLQTARISPDAPAIRFGADLHVTYSEFAQHSAGMAQYLSETLGVTKGDRVALFMRNRPEYLEVLHAVLWLGAIVVPINYKRRGSSAMPKHLLSLPKRAVSFLTRPIWRANALNAECMILV